jgi:putative ABC transport system permease protein
MVVRQGIGLAGAGIILGLAAAWALSRSLESFLSGVKARDPIVFIVVPVVLGAIALIAVWMPARRASRVNPMDVLRWE